MTGAAEQLRRIRAGVLCLGGTTLIAGMLFGRAGVASAAAGSALALGVQLLAAHLVSRTGVRPSVDHLMVYGFGVVVRMLGVAILALLLIRMPDRLEIWPAVLGYLGSVLPLLVLEIRLGQ